MDLKLELKNNNYICGIASEFEPNRYIEESLPNTIFAKEICAVIETIPFPQEHKNSGIIMISTAKSEDIIVLEIFVEDEYIALSELFAKSAIIADSDIYSVDFVNQIAVEWWEDEIEDSDDPMDGINIEEFEPDEDHEFCISHQNAESPYIREKVADKQRTIFVLSFPKLDNIVMASKATPNLAAANIEMYKLKGKYYLIINSLIAEDEYLEREVLCMQKFVDICKEFAGQFENPKIMAHIREHGEEFPEDTFENLKQL